MTQTLSATELVRGRCADVGGRDIWVRVLVLKLFDIRRMNTNTKRQSEV